MILLGTVCGVYTKAWNLNFLPVSGEREDEVVGFGARG